jgi:lipopolysaccharide/colanic/teichoic acid biosynthesis glycosyltransferase
MEDYRMVQRFTVIVVPMLQLLLTAPVALIVLLRTRL